MPTFDLRFMKVVPNRTGPGRNACQLHLTLEAPDEDEAIRTANGEFCRRRHIGHWSFHADAVEVRSAPMPASLGRPELRLV